MYACVCVWRDFFCGFGENYLKYPTDARVELVDTCSRDRSWIETLLFITADSGSV